MHHARSTYLPAATFRNRKHDYSGCIRTTVDQSGNVDGYDDYYPFGLVMPGRSSNTGNPNDSYKFTGHELDDEAGIDLYYMIARGMDPVTGLFMQIDPHHESYPGWSTYAYTFNNPIRYWDPLGMDPWPVSADWDEETIKRYRTYVADRAEQYFEGEVKCTCEDFALNVLIDFASENELPLTIENGTGTYSATSDDFDNVDDFRNAVLKSTGARDLENSTNTTSGSIYGAQPGDLILSTTRNDQKPSHVQVVTSLSQTSIGIHQGNLKAGFFGSSNPSSIFYGGVAIQKGTLNTQTGTYTRGSTTINGFMKSRNGQVRVWNFGGWKR